MALHLEDYSLIGNTRTAALVGKNGSIDWFCFPRFDSQACFASLLGTPENGRWLVGPKEKHTSTRNYRENSLVLETHFKTASGVVRVTDCMPIDHEPTIIRLVEGIEGEVEMQLEAIIRFEYGSVVPWVRKNDGGIRAIAGPHALQLYGDVPFTGKNFQTLADFKVKKGERVSLIMVGYASHRDTPKKITDPLKVIQETDAWWKKWCAQSTYKGDYQKEVMRSLMTLKALTYAPTGGIIAAPTTSLPEDLGGVRNWDYRYCWLRDSTFTLHSFMAAGYQEEAAAWREWLLRAVAGKPTQMRIMYGISGERQLTESKLDWLSGYENSQPVRLGNAAHEQFQMDVFGELADALYLAAKLLPTAIDHKDGWRLLRGVIEHLEDMWEKPDEGIWEIRGEPRHFVYSKVMAWVAFDRGIKLIEEFKVDGPRERWKKIREKIHREVMTQGYNSRRNTFTQHYGCEEVDASLLLLPLTGFIKADDARMVGTVQAIESDLLQNGFILRYRTDVANVDGLPGGEGAFLACTFWYVDNLILQGRREEAEQVFRRLLALTNEVGLLSEEYDVVKKRLCGNFPQAFSHISLVNTAKHLSDLGGTVTWGAQSFPK